MSQLDQLLKSVNVAEMGEILNALAHEDALKIFVAAKVGITKSTSTIKKLGLTQKRYYSRLKELMEASLIEKRDNAYQLTTTGSICYTLGRAFNEALGQRDRLDLADRLKRSKSISMEETKEILQALTRKGITGSIGVADVLEPVKLFDTYESLVTALIDQIDRAEKNIYVASYYSDSRVVEAVLRASQRGLYLSFLTGRDEGVADKMQLIRLMLNPKMAKLYFTLLGEQIRVRQSDFPYSFFVLDEKVVIIELPNPLTNTFYTGFSVQNEGLSRRLIKAYEALYKTGKEHPLLSQVKRRYDEEIVA